MSGLAVSGGVVVDDDPKVEHAFVGFFSQARTVEKDAQDGGAVGRGDRVRGDRVRGDRGRGDCRRGDARTAADAGAVDATIRVIADMKAKVPWLWEKKL